MYAPGKNTRRRFPRTLLVKTEILRPVFAAGFQHGARAFRLTELLPPGPRPAPDVIAVKREADLAISADFSGIASPTWAPIVFRFPFPAE